MADLNNNPGGLVVDEPPEVETDDDPRPWIRDYVVCAAVQGDFGSPSAACVVERIQRDGGTGPDDVAYLVRIAAETDAEAPIHDMATNTALLARKTGAGQVVLDGTVCGAPMLRLWRDAIDHPRRFTALRISDREPPDLGGTHRFPLTGVSRLDLLGAVRVAHDQTGGLAYTKRSLLARDALAEYKAKLDNLTPEEEEWAPPPSWHLVLALGIGVWALMEQPPEVTTFPRRDLDWQCSDRFRFDRRQLRTATEAAELVTTGAFPSPEAIMRRSTPERSIDGMREFVWLS